MDFYNFRDNGNKNEHSTEQLKIPNFILNVSSVAAMLSAVRDDLWPTASCMQCVRSKLSQKVIKCLSFSLFDFY